MHLSKIELIPGYFVLLAFLLLILPLPWVTAMIIGAAVHELGHITALRILRVPVYRMRIQCTGAYLETGLMTPVQEIICAAAGPAAGLLMLLLFSVMPKAAIVCLIHSVFNLLPIYPFDGGRILNGIVSKFCGENAAISAQKWIRWGSCAILAFLVLLFLPLLGVAGVAAAILFVCRTVTEWQTN